MLTRVSQAKPSVTSHVPILVYPNVGAIVPVETKRAHCIRRCHVPRPHMHAGGPSSNWCCIRRCHVPRPHMHMHMHMHEGDLARTFGESRTKVCGVVLLVQLVQLIAGVGARLLDGGRDRFVCQLIPNHFWRRRKWGEISVFLLHCGC